MKNFPVIENENTRLIYKALLTAARLLLKEDRVVRVLEGAVNNPTNSFDVSHMARSLNNELEEQNYGVKMETPENSANRVFDEIEDAEFFRSLENPKTFGPDPRALKSFDGVDDEAFFRGLTNPDSGYR